MRADVIVIECEGNASEHLSGRRNRGKQEITVSLDLRVLLWFEGSMCGLIGIGATSLL